MNILEQLQPEAYRAWVDQWEIAPMDLRIGHVFVALDKVLSPDERMRIAMSCRYNKFRELDIGIQVAMFNKMMVEMGHPEIVEQDLSDLK